MITCAQCPRSMTHTLALVLCAAPLPPSCHAVTQNAFGELCSLQKIEGCGLSAPQLMRCVRLAATKVEELTAALRKALEAHAVARVAARVRRQPGAAPPAGAAGAPARGVTVLRSDQLLPAVAGGGTKGAAAAGGAVALDLDALPDSVRSMLQQVAEGAEDMEEDGEESSSEDESSSGEGESSSGEESSGEEEAGGEVETAEASAAAAAVPAGVRAAAQQHTAAAAAEPAQQERPQQRAAGQPKKRRAAAPGSTSKEQQRDELAAIADMIASAGGGTSRAPADLSGAVKKKKKPASQAARRQ